MPQEVQSQSQISTSLPGTPRTSDQTQRFAEIATETRRAKSLATRSRTTQRSGNQNSPSLYQDADIPDSEKRWLKNQADDGLTVFDPTHRTPRLSDLRYTPENGLALDIIDHQHATFTTNDGTTYAVSRAYRPNIFKQLLRLQDQFNEVSQIIQDKHLKTLVADDDFPVINKADIKTLADGFKELDTSRGRYVVSASLTPGLYGLAVDASTDENGSDIDPIFKQHGLPAGADTNFMEAKTTATNDDGEQQTVGELYMSSLADKYQDMPEDSVEHQYLQLLVAKSHLNGGYQVLPYAETDAGPDNPRFHRSHQDGAPTTASYDNPTDVTPANYRGLINEEKLDHKLSKLLKNDDLIQSNKALMNQALDKVKDPQALSDTIYDAMSSDDYTAALEAAQKLDPDAAEARYGQDLAGLQKLDDKLGTNRADRISVQHKFGVSAERLNDVLNQPLDDMDSQELNRAFTDAANVIISTLGLSALGIDGGDAVANALVHGDSTEHLSADQKKQLEAATNVRDALKTMLRDNFQKEGKLSSKDIDKALKSADVPTAYRSPAKRAIHKLSESGALKTFGFMAQFGAGLYQVSGGGLSLGEDSSERLIVARTFLGTVGLLPGVVKGSADGIGKILNKPGMAEALGISDDLTWKDFHDKYPKSGGKLPTGSPPDIPLEEMDPKNVAKKMWQTLEAEAKKENLSTSKKISQTLKDGKLGDYAKSITSSTGADTGSGSGKAARAGAYLALKTVGTIADAAGGAIDLYFGAKGVDDLRENGGSDAEYAWRSLQIASGSVLTIGGFAGLGAVVGIAGAGAVAAGAGLVGLVIGGVAAIIGAIIQHHKQDEARDEIIDNFNYLSGLGVTEKDWGDKLNYMLYTMHAYHDKLDGDGFKHFFPDDRPFWEAQPEQYQEFTHYIDEHPDGVLPGNWFEKREDDLTRHVPADEQAFYDDHQESFETIRQDWNDWNGGDKVVSDEDLEDIAKDPLRGQADRDAARFLLNEANASHVDYLDTMQFDDNHTDGKISNDDLNDFLAAVGADQPTIYNGDSDTDRFDAKAFYSDHEDAFDEIRDRWNDWNGSDDIVSRKDLRDYAHDGGDDADVAEFLLKNDQAYDHIDAFRKGSPDGKISTHDLDAWLDSVDARPWGQKAYDDNVDTFHTISKHWNDWNGGDDIVSRHDLRKFADDHDRSDKERAAAQFLLDHDDIFAHLDGIDLNESPDGKISTGDLHTFFDNVGAKTWNQTYFDDHSDDFRILYQRWDEWNGHDAIVSKKDFHKIINDNDTPRAERDAVQRLLDHPDVFDSIDAIDLNESPDGKISTDDLKTWLEGVGAPLHEWDNA